jgi:hypothetical protein
LLRGGHGIAFEVMFDGVEFVLTDQLHRQERCKNAG